MSLTPPVICRNARRSNSCVGRPENIHTLRATDPSAKLAAAEHALARIRLRELAEARPPRRVARAGQSHAAPRRRAIR